VPEITNRGKGPFADKEDYHVNMASFLLLARWFDFLKTNGVWDNTRIIIVSDHGFSPTGRIPSHFSNEIILPNEDSVESYNCLLMVKDFGANGDVRTDNTFMTNADVPLLAVRDIVENPVNPFTGSPLTEDKADGVTITTSHLWETSKQKKYTFDIKPNEWLHVRNNIFDLTNWGRVTP
jgi:arylsulfatase A-like enzyme